MEVPGLRLEASFAVVPASGYEKRDTDARAIGDVYRLDFAVIHSVKKHPDIFAGCSNLSLVYFLSHL